MRGRSRRSSTNRTGNGIVACLAILGVAGVGGLAAGFMARAGLTPEPSSAIAATIAATIAQMSPSDTVDLRFPADWTEAAADAAPRMLAFASADGGMTLFSPKPIYPLTEAKDLPPVVQTPAKPKPAMALASASSKPVVAKQPPYRSNAVLSDSQIASIKKRLALTPDQERYWPAVEAELRKMEYLKDKSAQGTRMAQVDVSKVDVEGLKSAGFPLVMSFSDDQRRELKSLAHLLGLESAMAGI